VSTTLHDRLRRMGRPAPPPSELEALERTLVGDDGSGLSLKARLERLVAVASARSRTTREPARGRPPALEELIQGRRVENDRGEFFVVDWDYPLESFHGAVPLSRFRALEPASVGVLAGDPALGEFDLSKAAFLDTETTGLAGGTGTAAFLIGLGFVEEDRFRVRQYFMRDYHEEPALLRGLAQDLVRFRHVVTFNGRTFDLPLLEARYRLNRERYPLADMPHLDLLPPARRLWKLRLVSCRLQALEVDLLDVRRRADVPGEEIPRIYFDYVRRRDGRALLRVLEHNRVDVVSLAALAVLACQWVEDGRAEDPRDVYSLAQVLEQARLFERCESEYRRVADAEAGPLRVEALLKLARYKRRAGDHAAAADLWGQAALTGDWRARRALAIYHEHRSRDLTSALTVVEQGLADLGGASGRDVPYGLERVAADLRRRRHRLIAKRARAANCASPGALPAARAGNSFWNEFAE
jgi:uncharacterized protein YprB with RNaseH-like and TPR domain